MIYRVVAFGVICALLFSAPAALSQQKDAAKMPAEKSLYDRLGGVYAIATVVDDFIDRVVDDAILNANPRIKEARDRVPKAGLKYRVTELVCQVTGGPCMYTGRSMKDSHKHLNITEKDWQALVDNFKMSLDKFKVPGQEQKELFAIVESTKKDIVMPTAVQKR